MGLLPIFEKKMDVKTESDISLALSGRTTGFGADFLQDEVFAAVESREQVERRDACRRVPALFSVVARVSRQIGRKRARLFQGWMNGYR
jgi:hypothetical protein